MAKPQSITSMPQSPDDERRRRIIVYTIQMSIRVVCLVLCVIVPGWWVLIPAAGALALPLIAVVMANAIGSKGSAPVLRPGAIQKSSGRP